MPVPESAMFRGELEALETMERVPLAEPVAVGVKVAAKVTLSLAVRVVGKVNPLMENAAPVTLACEMVTEEPPVLVSVSERFVLLPTATLPKLRLLLERVTLPPPPPGPSPWQAASSIRQAAARKEAAQRQCRR